MCPFADAALIRVEWSNGTWYQVLVNANGIFEYESCFEAINPCIGVLRREIASYVIHDMLSGPMGYEKQVGTPDGSQYHWTFTLRKDNSDYFQAEGYSGEPDWRHDRMVNHLAFLTQYVTKPIRLP